MFAFMLGAALAMPAQAQWKWVDKDKRVQYSDLPPPPGVAEQDILQRPRGAERPAAASPAPTPASAAASSAPLLVPKTAEPELEAKRKKAEQEEAAKKKAEQDRIAAIKADNCSRAQAQMRTLDSGVRIARTNTKGEREVLDDAGRAEEVKRTKAMLSSECK